MKLHLTIELTTKQRRALEEEIYDEPHLLDPSFASRYVKAVVEDYFDELIEKQSIW